MNTYEWIDSLPIGDRLRIETAMLYTSSTRAAHNGDPTVCVMLTEDGRMCAVSRCMTDYARRLVPNGAAVATIEAYARNLGIPFQDMFLPEYRGYGHGELFWAMRYAQRLHDSWPFWDETGLSADGWDHLCHTVEVTR